MKISPLIRNLLSLVFLVGLVASNENAMAAKPETLEISDAYYFSLISVRTDSLGEFGIRLEVVDNSTGVWRGPAKQTKPVPAAGQEVELALTNTFSDDSVVDTKVSAKIEGNSIKVRGEWPNDSTVQGFVRLDLWFSQEMAEDLTISANGQVLTTNMDQTSTIMELDDVEFRKTSTGEFLFRVTGNFFASVMFLPDSPSQGLWLRLDNSRNPNAASISDVTEMEYTISFDK
jgi:hypothetical protein